MSTPPPPPATASTWAPGQAADGLRLSTAGGDSTGRSPHGASDKQPVAGEPTPSGTISREDTMVEQMSGTDNKVEVDDSGREVIWVDWEGPE